MLQSLLTRLSAFVVAILLFVSPVLAGGVGGYPVTPLDSNNTGWFVYKLKPGETYNDVIAVKNSTEQSWIVDMYPADTTTSSGGGFALRQKSEKMEKMGTWIKLSTNQVTLGPDEVKNVPFTITIPENAEVGETAGGIMFEKRDPKTGGDDVIKKEGGVKLSLRTGVRVYNTVPGEIVEKLVIEDFKVKPNDGNKKITYFLQTKVKNTGNISTHAKFHYEITDVFSGKQVEKTDSKFLVNRNSTFENNFEWVNAPLFGKFSVKVQVKSELRDGTEKAIGEKEATFWVIPTKEIAIAVGVLLLLIAFLVWRKIKYSGRGWIEYEIQKDDSLVSIATAHNVNWKLLAKTNKIEAPYFISPGSKIRVPPKKES
jgi:hypothetical protein